MPEALTTETGMTRREIDLARENAILKSEDKMREEFRDEVKAVRAEIGAIGDELEEHRKESSANLSRIDAGQLEILRKLDQALDNQESLKAKQKELEEKVAGVSNLKIAVEETTPDGRTIVKHFQSWKDTYLDLKALFTAIAAIATFVGGWKGVVAIVSALQHLSK